MQSNIQKNKSKKIKILRNPKLVFGTQLKKYREETGMTQKEYADFHRTKQTYITELERGNKDVQIGTMQKHASAFGVNYFQMGDPDFPVPILAEMPLAIRKAAAKAAKIRERREKEKQTRKVAGSGVYKVGVAKKMHGLIISGFFKQAKTSKEAYLKLYPGIKEVDLTGEHRKAISSLTTTLSKGKFAKLLDKLDPAPGTNAIRFMEKAAADKSGYGDTSDSTNIAAEKS